MAKHPVDSEPSMSITLAEWLMNQLVALSLALGWLIWILFALIFCSTGILFLAINESHITDWNGNINWATAVSQSSVLAPNPNIPLPDDQGKLITLTGPIVASPPIGDGSFMATGSYAVLHRTVELYEKGPATSPSHQRKYRWTYIPPPNPTDSVQGDSRRSPRLHPITSATLVAPTLRIGPYKIDSKSLTTVTNAPNSCENNNRIFYNKPNGGIRLPESKQSMTPKGSHICYSAIANGATVTIVGQLQGDRIVPSTYRSQPVFWLLSGTREEAIDGLKSDHQAYHWGIHSFGFLLSWIGLAMLSRISGRRSKPNSIETIDVLTDYGTDHSLGNSIGNSTDESVKKSVEILDDILRDLSAKPSVDKTSVDGNDEILSTDAVAAPISPPATTASKPIGCGCGTIFTFIGAMVLFTWLHHPLAPLIALPILLRIADRSISGNPDGRSYLGAIVLSITVSLLASLIGEPIALGMALITTLSAFLGLNLIIQRIHR
jgi:Transmembrane protein 43